MNIQNTTLIKALNLTVSAERSSVLLLPGSSSSRTRSVVVSVSLLVTSGLLTSGSKTTSFTVLVNWVNNPVDTSVTTNGLVGWVDKNNFVVLVSSIFINPVGV
jgi:hypothetical protein